MPDERAHAERDELRRGVVTAQEQRDRRAQELGLGQPATLEVRGDERAQQVVRGPGAPLVEQVVDPGAGLD